MPQMQKYSSQKPVTTSHTDDIFIDHSPYKRQDPQFNQAVYQSEHSDLSGISFGVVRSNTKSENGIEAYHQLEDDRKRWANAVQETEAKLMPKLKSWEGQPDRHHIRVLLCTLRMILWPEHGF